MTLKSLIDKPIELLEYLHDNLKPKYTEKKKYGEVFTPMSIVNNMLDTLPNKVWTNKDLKWLDPANGMGNYPIAIYLRLINSLDKVIPDYEKRKKHILENMLYMCDINKNNNVIAKKIFDINNKYKLNIYHGDSLSLDSKTIFKVDKFDIVLGNPPYNKAFNNAGASPLYNLFIQKFIDNCNYMLFLVPSRWFTGGKGLDSFRKFMLKRTDIKLISHYDDSSKIFGPSIIIKGGVNYFLKDNSYHNILCNFNVHNIQLGKYDVFIDSKYYNIVDKLVKFKSLDTIYLGNYHDIITNDKRLIKSNENKQYLIKCYVSQQKGFIKYINKKHLKYDYNFYKVITAHANGADCFGNMFIGDKTEVHTGSYISFKVSNKKEADSLLSYLKCKLPNFMLNVRKRTQHINTSTCKWIPLPPLDKIWTDDLVYKHFKLSVNDIKLVKDTKLRGYKELNN